MKRRMPRDARGRRSRGRRPRRRGRRCRRRSGCPGARAERPLEVLGRVALSASMKTRSNGRELVGVELRQRVERRPDAQVDELAEAGARDVRCARPRRAAGRPRASPAGRRAAARARARSCCSRRACRSRGSRARRQPREQVQQLALRRRDVDRRQAGRPPSSRERAVERLVGRHEQPLEVRVDRSSQRSRSSVISSHPAARRGRWARTTRRRSRSGSRRPRGVSATARPPPRSTSSSERTSSWTKSSA